MSEFEWEEENWETLIYAIQQNNCILMLGPDTEIEEVEGTPRPLTEILASDLFERITPEIKKKIDPFDLAQVAQFYCMDRGRHGLEARVRTFYNERPNVINNLYRNLAALPFYFTVVTTPDNMFIEALREKGKEPITERYHFNGENPDLVKMGTIQKPLLFYLYGTVAEPSSLLLTENDLLDFLVALISKKKPLPNNVLSELHDENKSFLFLGFGFRHWYLRILLHVLQGRGKGSHSFAMEQFMPGNAAELERTIFFFKKSDYKLDIYKGELNHFSEQLVEKYMSSSKKSTPPNAPEVFICHASEDKKYATFLYKKLEEAEIKPWLDEQNLRGGAKWDPIIDKTIKKVDYFVVLQSKALENKKRGYVFKEIQSALNYEKHFRSGLQFIIPIKIEECDLYEDLEHLHTITIHLTENNIEKLITTIKRDFEKRGKQ